MKIAISGGTGFIGRHLVSYLSDHGHEIILITRTDFAKGAHHLVSLLQGLDAVINLAGAPIVKRWSEAYKQEILSSRIATTNAVVEAMGQIDDSLMPKTLISASAIGIYGTCNMCDESSTEFGHDFLAEVCQQWESCLEPLDQQQVRTCIVRLGLVLGRDGGSLQRLVPIFKAGLGGRIGAGRQGFSFIHIRDLCSAIEFLLTNDKSRGIYNLVSPEVTTTTGFTKALARTLNRPAFFTIPPFSLRLVYGEAAEAIMAGQFVFPKRLLEEGFHFEYGEIHQALAAILK